MSLHTNSRLKLIDITGIKIRKPCLKSYFEPALKVNITLKYIIGKIPPNTIHQDLQDNRLIEDEIEQDYNQDEEHS